jgi:rhodanese-related sulfurtransferase
LHPLEIDLPTFESLRTEGVYVLDVRETDEFSGGHVAGAVNIPLPLLPVRAHELPTDRRLAVICAAGGRSMQAVRALTEAGYDAVSVAGGTGAWVRSGRAVVTGA